MIAGIIIIPIILLMLIMPMFSTIRSIYTEDLKWQKMSYWFSYIYTGLFFLIIKDMEEYNVALVMDLNPLHTPISQKYIFPILVFVLLHLIACYLIMNIKIKKTPVIMAICSLIIFFGILLDIVLIVQLFKNIKNIFELVPIIILMPINNILISVYAVKR